MSSRTKYALLLVAVLGIVLRHTAGIYDPGVLAILAVTIGCMAIFIYRKPSAERLSDKEHALDLALTSLVLLFSYALHLDPVLDFLPLNRETGELPDDLVRPFYWHAFILQFMPVLAFLLWLHCLTRGDSPKWLRVALVAIAFLLLVLQRILTVVICPYAKIDVWVSNQAACMYLLEGSNPYTGFYPDIYDGLMGYAPGFGYWPGYLYWATPFRYLFGDVRYSSVFSDVVTGLTLVVIGHKLKIPFRTTCLFPLVWLTFPVGMFVTEHAWIDPNLICFISLLILCLLYERWILVALIAGWIAGTKQYGGLVGLLTLAYIAGRQPRKLLQITLISELVLASLVQPFLLISRDRFYESTIGVLANAPLRKDPLSLVGLWINTTGIGPSGGALAAFSLVVNLSVVGATCWWLFRSRDKSPLNLIGGLMICYFAFFFTGKFAFCNYYYLVTSLVLMYFVLSLGEDLKRTQPTTAEETI